MQEVSGDVLRACQQGDRAAFATLVEIYAPRVQGILRRMTRDTALAEDLAQEAFTRAFVNIVRFDPRRGPFSTWLFTIVRNLCRTHLAKESARTRAFRVLKGEAVESSEPEQTSSNSRPITAWPSC